MGLHVRRSGTVATVELSHPGRRNALSADMFADLARMLPELDDDPGPRVVVLTGAGEDFCSGADLSWAHEPDHCAATVWDLGAGTRGRRVFEKGDPDTGIRTVGQRQGLTHDIPRWAS